MLDWSLNRALRRALRRPRARLSASLAVRRRRPHRARRSFEGSLGLCSKRPRESVRVPLLARTCLSGALRKNFSIGCVFVSSSLQDPARAGGDPVLLPPLVWCARFIYLFSRQARHRCELARASTKGKEFYNKRRSHDTIHATGEARATASSEAVARTTGAVTPPPLPLRRPPAPHPDIPTPPHARPRRQPPVARRTAVSPAASPSLRARPPDRRQRRHLDGLRLARPPIPH